MKMSTEITYRPAKPHEVDAIVVLANGRVRELTERRLPGWRIMRTEDELRHREANGELFAVLMGENTSLCGTFSVLREPPGYLRAFLPKRFVGLPWLAGMATGLLYKGRNFGFTMFRMALEEAGRRGATEMGLDSHWGAGFLPNLYSSWGCTIELNLRLREIGYNACVLSAKCHSSAGDVHE